METSALWSFLPLGYVISVLIEGPILLLGLSPRHGLTRRLFAAFWLTACTYPVVVLVLPVLLEMEQRRFTYLLVAESFAPIAESLLFWCVFVYATPRDTLATLRDCGAITFANLASFGLGGWILS
jgi:hypothetical protein